SPQGRGRRGPALEQATYEVSFPTRPFIVPFRHLRSSDTHEKGRRYPQNACSNSAVCTGFFPMRNQVLSQPCPFYTPKVATSLRRRPLGSEVEEVIIGCKDHQHSNDCETAAKPHLLTGTRKRFPPHGFDCVVQQVTAIEQRHGEQIEQPDRDRKHRREAEQ